MGNFLTNWNDELHEIIDHYGKDHQLDKLEEEIAELWLAIRSTDKNAITEELADVLVMLGQVIIMRDLDPDSIEKMMGFKIVRTINRMRCER
jgi:NTP pyrophosphatase (non-canonical NTP hydrolase)